MALTKPSIAALYGRRAKNYDLSANLYHLIGIREHHYRKQAVEALALEPGDVVVEVGCGTGLNFGLVRKSVVI